MKKRRTQTVTLTRHPVHAELWLTPDGQVFRKLPVWVPEHPRAYPAVTGHGVRGLTTGAKAIHCLMLETFCGPRPEGWQALHRDDDRLNWHIDNLYWGTPFDNHLDRIDNRKP
jgi:hypothetical protein